MRPKNTPNDPDRRERIVHAAIRLVRAGGIASVTARSVATEAGVPVGSVAYHFDSVPALLLEAGSRVLRLRTDTLVEWLAGTSPANVVTRLAELIHHQLTEQRETSVVAYELYMLGMRHEEFRQVSRLSNARLRERLAEVLPPAEAARLAAAADGFQLQCLFEVETPTVDQIEWVLTG
ncbi:TetR/AcrR family transcriptional regulator [Amycolatopsis solani]|uniref:TetR/AcrR family transcriptional regulator n=1 Tax=Amycolatopsis solani TaxID=3028615 RepID=UPI0025B15AB3|nr:TetR family transcriptional regulator [Amycolatopsis sp. MEP2-6]